MAASFTLKLQDPPFYNFDFNPQFQACYDLVSEKQFRLGLSSFPLTITECANRVLFKFTWVAELRGPEDDQKESLTHKILVDNPISMLSTIYYWTEDINKCPDIVCARFFHEATHAIRWLQALETGDVEDTPPESPEKNAKYMLEGRNTDSGYMLEHIYFNGIISHLFGILYTCCEDPQKLTMPCYAKISRLESKAVKFPDVKKGAQNIHLDRMNAQLWNTNTREWGPFQDYYFNGIAKTRRNTFTGHKKLFT